MTTDGHPDHLPEPLTLDIEIRYSTIPRTIPPTPGRWTWEVTDPARPSHTSTPMRVVGGYGEAMTRWGARIAAWRFCRAYARQELDIEGETWRYVAEGDRVLTRHRHHRKDPPL